MENPKSIIDLENLACRLAEIKFPKHIIQKMKNIGLYNQLYGELRDRLGQLEVKEMLGRSPITYTTETGYKFLVSE